MKQIFGLGLIEITLLIYGMYLLQHQQYLTLLILLLLSFILIMKGINYKESVLIAIVFILFITQYHRYFPSRNDNDNDNSTNIDKEDDGIENFRNRELEDLKLKTEKIERRKKRKERKKIKSRVEKEISKNESDLPIQYIKNKVKIKKKAESWGESLGKWYLFKENFLLLLNN